MFPNWKNQNCTRPSKIKKRDILFERGMNKSDIYKYVIAIKVNFMEIQWKPMLSK